MLTVQSLASSSLFKLAHLTKPQWSLIAFLLSDMKKKKNPRLILSTCCPGPNSVNFFQGALGPFSGQWNLGTT